MPAHDEEKASADVDKELRTGERSPGRQSATSSRTAGADPSRSSSTGSVHQSAFLRDEEKPHRTSEPNEVSTAPEVLASNAEVEAQQNQNDEEGVLPPAVPKPRSERRGLFARFCIIDEVDEPKHYSRSTKWTITAFVAFASVAAPIGSNIILPSLTVISEDLGSSQTLTNLSIAFYVLALGVFPIFWSSFSEVLGRRSVYVISFGTLTVFNVLSALSVNIAMFLVMRILSGACSASVQAVGAGTIADVWHVRERGNAMSMYYLGPLMGPLLAPIIGGALQIRFGWRSTMWFNSIYGIVTFLLLTFCLPETIAKTKKFGAKDTMRTVPVQAPASPALSRVASRQSLKQGSKTVMLILNGIFIQPLAILQFLQFAPVLLTIYYAGITFGALYMLQISVENTFSGPPYNFSTLEVGLTYIPASFGYFTCSFVAGRWTDHVMAREARRAGRRDERGKLIYRPEDRMKENIWLAAILYPCALLWWGWSSEYKVFWFVPCLANFFFGFGSMLVFSTVTTMLTEFMPNNAASAVGLNNLCRMVTAAVGICVAQPLLDAIGSGPTFTLVAGIALLSASSIWAMTHFGPRWRKTMDQRMKEKGWA